MAFNATTVTAQCFAIVPSTNGQTRFTAFGFYVGTGGNVNVIDSHGNTVLFTAVASGTQIAQAICCVRTTNTTASNLVGFGPS